MPQNPFMRFNGAQLDKEHRRTLYVVTLDDDELTLDWCSIVRVLGDIQRVYYSGEDQAFIVFKDPLAVLDVTTRHRKLKLFGKAKTHRTLGTQSNTYQERMAFAHFNTIIKKPERARLATFVAKDIMRMVRGAGVVTQAIHPDGKLKEMEDLTGDKSTDGDEEEEEEEEIDVDILTEDVRDGVRGQVMDIANNLKRTREEVELVRNYMYLIEYD